MAVFGSDEGTLSNVREQMIFLLIVFVFFFFIEVHKYELRVTGLVEG